VPATSREIEREKKRARRESGGERELG